MGPCAACGEENPPTARFCGGCGRQLTYATSSRPVRKIVTVLFSDLTGSTSLGEQLDAESLRAMLEVYFASMRGAISEHGGQVAKFIGDAVMAVFGIPTLHEDDALRATRAAVEMQTRLVKLNDDFAARYGVRLAVRMGLHTGEILDEGVAAGSALALGDTVNTAARLEQAADAGEILLSRATWELVREAVDAEPVAPIAAKGKAEPLAALRFVQLRGGQPERAPRTDARMVGRHAQVQTLHDAWVVARQGGPRLVVVIGAAGVGKSRLIAEFVDAVGSGARVLTGRCLPYGQGITFWPLGEVARAAADIVDADSPDHARAKLAAVVQSRPDGELIATRVGELIGLAPPAASLEETFWATRVFLSTLAHSRPLIVVIDDLHWAEPALLDLVESFLELPDSVPLLIVCVARHELTEVRPNLGAGARAQLLKLHPLDDTDAAALVAQILPATFPRALVERIITASGGNPLFAEEIVAMFLDDGILQHDGALVAPFDVDAVRIPPSISALLGARLDRLAPAERYVLESASVVGQSFWSAAVAQLAPVEIRPETAVHLLALVRREMIRAEGTSTFGDDSYRFWHLLLRDAAYSGMAKANRADLHEQFATWLEVAAGERVAEYEAIIGYHLEAAWRYRTELALPTEAETRLGERAAGWLTRAGRRALGQADLAATVNLLERAVGLLPPEATERARILPILAVACFDAGNIASADRFRDDALAAVAASGDRLLAVRSTLSFTRFSEFCEHDGWAQNTTAAAREAIEIFTTLGDEEGLAEAWHALFVVEAAAGQNAKALDCLGHALEHARHAGSSRLVVVVSCNMALLMGWGATPTSEGARRCRAMLDDLAGHRVGHAFLLMPLALLEAAQGDFAEARRHLATGRGILEELGRRVDLGIALNMAAEVEHLAGDPAAGELAAREALDIFRAAGVARDARYAAAELARALLGAGRLDESERWAREAGDEDSGVGRTVLAQILARRGEHGSAERLAQEVIDEIGASGELRYEMGPALLGLADIEVVAQKNDRARAVLMDVVAFAEAKEHAVILRRARERLAALGNVAG